MDTKKHELAIIDGISEAFHLAQVVVQESVSKDHVDMAKRVLEAEEKAIDGFIKLKEMIHGSK